MDLINRQNKTSMAYWLPIIKDLPIHMPKTTLIPITYGEGMDYLSEQTHKDVELAVIKMEFPCFIKKLNTFSKKMKTLKKGDK